MEKFSVRHGHQAARTAIQTDDLDNDARVALWNALDEVRDEVDETWDPDVAEEIGRAFWTDELGAMRDEYSDISEVWDAVRQRTLRGPWWAVMDLVEGLLEALNESREDADAYELLVDGANRAFSRHLVGYRVTGARVVPIDSQVALDAIDSAREDASATVRHHLDRGLELLADRQTPDYANSIKESISAVEAAIRISTGAATLGDGIKQLQGAGVDIHPALARAWSAMYGWTSDAAGIRHGGIAAPAANQALAKYMLVTCSAFVSYLLEVGGRNPESE